MSGKLQIKEQAFPDAEGAVEEIHPQRQDPNFLLEQEEREVVGMGGSQMGIGLV